MQVKSFDSYRLLYMNKSELIREVHERMDKKMTMKEIVKFKKNTIKLNESDSQKTL